MPFTLPNFNLSTNVWDPGVAPNSNPPTFVENAQLYVNSKMIETQAYLQVLSAQVWVEIRFPKNPGVYKAGQICEIPASSGYYAKVFTLNFMHRGFPNEYIALGCYQCDIHGVPTNWLVV